jgi:CDP-diacylglycerol---glycerol-3-phosphate 3-phosphatidyltransferase
MNVSRRPAALPFGPSAVITPANAVTLLRVLATPVLIVLTLQLGPSVPAVAVWVLLSATDFFDGWLARRHGVTTSGAFLDPLADKVLAVGALAALAAGGWVSWVPVAILAGREALISVYRVALARRGVSVPARRLAKLKTATEDVAVGLILLPLTAHHALWIGRDLLWVAVGLALVSGVQYLLDSRVPAAASGVRAGIGSSPLVSAGPTGHRGAG